MADDVLLNKVAIIERCLARIGDEYRGHENELATNLTRQDAIIEEHLTDFEVFTRQALAAQNAL